MHQFFPFDVILFISTSFIPSSHHKVKISVWFSINTISSFPTAPYVNCLPSKSYIHIGDQRSFSMRGPQIKIHLSFEIAMHKFLQSIKTTLTPSRSLTLTGTQICSFFELRAHWPLVLSPQLYTVFLHVKNNEWYSPALIIETFDIQDS